MPMPSFIVERRGMMACLPRRSQGTVEAFAS